MKRPHFIIVASSVLLSLTCLQSLSHGECTSFCFSSHGCTYFATNFDYPNELDDGLLFVNRRGIKKSGWTAHIADGWVPDALSESTMWTSKYGSLTFNIVGAHMVWAGINEQGLTVSTMFLEETAAPKPSSKPVLDGGVWLQYLLDTCATVDEVVDAVDRFGVDTVNHHLFCDRNGRCAIIEFLDGKSHCRTGEQVPVSVLTNSVYDKSLAALGQATIDETDLFRSLARFRSVAECVAAFDEKKESALTFAFRTLSEAKQSTPTQWSIVFDLDGKRVSFKTREHTQVRSIDVGRLDFAPRAVQKMMSIQADVSDDMTDRLADYSHEQALAHTTQVLDAYLTYKGIAGPPDRRVFVERTVTFFERFGPVE